MFEFNWRGVAICFVITLMCVTMMVAISHAEPINITFGERSFVIVETIDGSVNITKYSENPGEVASGPTPYIQQGETVYLGDTVDISGAIPPYPQIAYWDGYDIYDSSPSYNFTMPDRKSAYYHFYLDPAIFAGRLGKWYKYNGEFEPRGNNLAFIVKPRPFYNYTMTFQNGTIVSLSELPNVTYLQPFLTPVPELMPQRHIADYLVTTDEPLNITVKKLSAGWIFNGDDNTIAYSINGTDNEILYSRDEIGYLEPGEYKLLVQTVGNTSTNFDVIFADKMIKWFDRKNFVIHTFKAENLVPSEAIKRLEQIFPLTYDSYEIGTVAVQAPAITIDRMDRVSVGSAKEYWKDSSLRGNVSLMDVRGYTNVLPGTNLSITLDETRNNPREIAKKFTYSGKAQGTYLGDMRYYQIYVPLYWDSLEPGMHTLTARTELGGSAAADFPVNEMPADSYIPPETIRYVGDRNPWVPTPTPVVQVQKEVVVVTQTVPVQIQPSDSQITEAAQKLVDEQNRRTEGMIIIAVIGMIGLAFIGWFGYSIWRANRK